MSKKVFVVDIDKCCGCRNCQISCKDEHCEQPWLPYAQAQPEVGQFWMNVREKERGQVPWVKVSYTPTLCAHCSDAPCEKVCQSGALNRRNDGLALIDPAVCTGCGDCLSACPIGAVYFNQELNIAQKCTGCAHLLDDGWSVPRCVDACPNGALQFGDEDVLADKIQAAEVLPDLEHAGSRVHYLGLPKRFVAGTYVDFKQDEVVIGATTELLDANESIIASTQTDEFGDFIFKQVDPSAYLVRISANGYDPVVVNADLTDRDLSLGNIPTR
jgi:Fe-S-cluster-containing dehydrogenase component